MKAYITNLLALYAFVHVITGLSLGPIPWHFLLGYVIKTALTLLFVPVAFVCIYWKILIDIHILVALICVAIGMQDDTRYNANRLHCVAHALVFLLIVHSLFEICNRSITHTLCTLAMPAILALGFHFTQRVYLLVLTIEDMGRQIDWLVANNNNRPPRRMIRRAVVAQAA
jgi:hypothetical protein